LGDCKNTQNVNWFLLYALLLGAPMEVKLAKMLWCNAHEYGS